MTSSIIQEKLSQAIDLLREHNLDCWLTFVRETSQTRDPALDNLLGFGLTWDSAIILTKQGEKIAIVGQYESDNVKKLNAYDRVIGYNFGIAELLRAELKRINPQKIGLNYSLSDTAADGLTFGMYARLVQMLAGTPYPLQFTTAEDVVRKLRERKSAAELARVREILVITEQAYGAILSAPLIGKNETEIHAMAGEMAQELGVDFGWERLTNPIVNAGEHSSFGHGIPNPDLKVEPGMILHLDMGLKKNEYCSDLQRCAYVLRDGETEPPETVTRAWLACWRAMEAGKAAIKPGVQGWVVDQAARDELTKHGYPEFMHALGHHVGRNVHDGGSVLGPRWEKYGERPIKPIEQGAIYTIELDVIVEGYGMIGLEEMLVVTADGCEYLSTPQREIALIRH